MTMTTLEELTKGLSPVQKKVLLRLLKEGEPMSSSRLGVSVSTMHALERKGLVKGKWRGIMVDAPVNKVWMARYKVKK